LITVRVVEADEEFYQKWGGLQIPDPLRTPQIRKPTAFGLRSVRSFEKEVTSWTLGQINSSGVYQRELAAIGSIPQAFASTEEYFSVYMFPLFEEV
jgi:hypothetical protein